ncbi:hypothetical protein ACI3L1_01940 [Deinococcus sp. SM5_A1]|uniref:hypothetical protein n=1 Tax=Deinococcus sp. SM5_A1 TaxID=3379094 RepID=UPI0038592605
MFNLKKITASLLLVTGLALSTAGVAGGAGPGIGSAGAVVASPTGVVPPVTVSACASGPVHWILPGPRRLDPAVFGTPQMPLGWQDAVGVPTG